MTIMNCKQLYQIVNNLPRNNKTVRTHNFEQKTRMYS